MDVNLVQEICLCSANARKMPVLGLGTASDPPADYDTTLEALLQAIEQGYRHFDTAALYKTEPVLGEAIAVAIERGLIKSRADVFITSKLWCHDAHADKVLPAIQKSLRNLNMEYLDLYLIHWPPSAKAGVSEYPIKKEDFEAMDLEAVWASMEECQNRGLTKAIGVSNFSCKKLSNLLAIAKIPPAVNQVEVNPCWQQQKLRDFCSENGILVVAYAALGAVGTFYGTNRVMESQVLKEIARARGKTVAQVCLRWGYEQRIGVLVKSFNKDRMKQNMEIFDWELTKEEARKISEIPQARAFPAHEFTSIYGPFKSIEELWDGEAKEMAKLIYKYFKGWQKVFGERKVKHNK